jgi:hypothetical protein
MQFSSRTDQHLRTFVARTIQEADDWKALSVGPSDLVDRAGIPPIKECEHRIGFFQTIQVSSRDFISTWTHVVKWAEHFCAQTPEDLPAKLN